MTELNTDLRKCYFPYFDFHADVDQLCLDYARRVATANGRKVKLPVVEREFTKILSNSLKIKETTDQEKDYIIQKLMPGARITLNVKSPNRRSIKQIRIF
jgi:hypothetical protein